MRLVLLPYVVYYLPISVGFNLEKFMSEAFSNKVSKEVQDKIELVVGLAEDLPVFDFDCDEVTRAAIPHQSYDGFISFNLGGFTLSSWFYNYGSGRFLTKGHREWSYGMEKMCLTDFARDYPGEALDSEEFDAYNREYMDEGTFIQFRCYVDDDGCIQVDLCVCYKDAPYYRSTAFEVIADVALSEERFMRLRPEAIIRWIECCYRKA